MKIEIFFENMLWLTPKTFLFTAIFFRRRFFRHCSTFRDASLLLKRAYIPKTTSPFLGGVMGNFFDFVLTVRFHPDMVILRQKFNLRQKYNPFLFHCKKNYLKL